MANVAHQRHGQVGQVALGAQHYLHPGKGRQRVGMGAVASVDDAQARRLGAGGTDCRAAGGMPQHQDAGRQAGGNGGGRRRGGSMRRGRVPGAHAMASIHARIDARAARERHRPQAQLAGGGLETLAQVDVAGRQAQEQWQVGGGRGGLRAIGKTRRHVEQPLDMAARQPFRGQQMNQFATAVELRIEHGRAGAGVKAPAACPGSVAG